MKIILLIIVSFVTFSAHAYEIEPFPVANISEEQWLTYYDEVNSEKGIEKREYKNEKLIIFSDSEKQATIVFTLENHDAHPSWVTRYVRELDGTISVNQVGYFAGNEKAFAALFQTYAEMVKGTQKKFEIK